MDLDDIRDRLDEIDEEIIKLIAKRQAYMPMVKDYKKQHGLTIHQPKREKEILEKKKELAKKLGVDEHLVEEVFLALFKNAKEIQTKE